MIGRTLLVRYLSDLVPAVCSGSHSGHDTASDCIRRLEVYTWYLPRDTDRGREGGEGERGRVREKERERE